jgi:hypothetical protein
MALKSSSDKPYASLMTWHVSPKTALWDFVQLEAIPSWVGEIEGVALDVVDGESVVAVSS